MHSREQARNWARMLDEHAKRLADTTIPQLLAAEPERAMAQSLRHGPILASFARQRIDAAAWRMLFDMADELGVPAALGDLVDGVEVNVTEHRPALHTALRSDLGRAPVAQRAREQALAAQRQAETLARRLADEGVTDVINIGIGGSDLGPRFVVDALREQADSPFRVHFLSNVDGHAATRLLRELDPARSAAVLVSKSFTTQETLLNGALVRDWLGGRQSLLAVSAEVARAEAFGIAAERVLPMWDWVGGRYSVWSAAGFAARLALGEDGWRQLLAGAADIDAHVATTPAADNLAVRHALVAVWNRVALRLPTHAVLPYDERLAKLPAYLQQLFMESLGKSVRSDGEAVAMPTGAVLWGAPGTDSQHSFFQALHQGVEVTPTELIGVIRPHHPHSASHQALLANLLAQSQAFANGAEHGDPHRRHPGNRPGTVFLLDALTPQALGGLLALYEHSVYVQSVIWGINAFDQWGVELGKRIAGDLLPALRGDSAGPDDPVTRALLAEVLRGG